MWNLLISHHLLHHMWQMNSKTLRYSCPVLIYTNIPKYCLCRWHILLKTTPPYMRCLTSNLQLLLFVLSVMEEIANQEILESQCSHWISSSELRLMLLDKPTSSRRMNSFANGRVHLKIIVSSKKMKLSLPFEKSQT